MKKYSIHTLIILVIFLTSVGNTYAQTNQKPFKGNEKQVAEWQKDRFGMFIHWGLYSLLSGEWNGERITFVHEWMMNFKKIPVNDYRAVASRFNPTQYNADDFVTIAKNAGMKYIVITSKHHEGFALFKSADPFNVVDATPFKRDIVAELAKACRKQGLKFGVYYSQGQDWCHAGGGMYCPHWDSIQSSKTMDQYIDEVAVPQVKELLTAYNPDIIWWDTPAEITPARAEKFLAVTNKYPKLIMNNRLCDKMDNDFQTPEGYVPATGIPGKKWESCIPMYDNWGYNKFDHNCKTPDVIIATLSEIVSKGGNYLLNVGPTPEGLIPQPSIDCLKEVGEWMKLNGEVIYGTTASPFANLKWGKATQKVTGKTRKIYLNVFDWPADGKLVITGLENKILKAYPLAKPAMLLSVKTKQPDHILDVSKVAKGKYSTVIVIEISGKPVVNEAPVVTSECSVYTAKVAFDISCNTPNGIIHYTTDGTEPTVKSPVATAKIMLEPQGNLVVKARTYVKGLPVSDIAEKAFKKEKPIPAIEVSNLQQGLSYKLYLGNWTKLPDFSQLTPVKTGIVDSLDLSPKLQPLYYGFVFNGYINVPETNVYTFFLTSDDGSKMIIDDTKVLDNDGAHGMDEKMLEVPLAAGYHKIAIQYFQNGGGDGLKLEWKELGGKRMDVDKNLLKR